jgi:PAS domain S-box-containing protein
MSINERKQAQEELNALYNALSILFQADSLQDLGQQIVQAVVKEFRQADCGLLLLSKDRKEIVRVARGGTYQVSTDVVLALDGLGLVPEALRLGKPVYAPDVMAHPQYLANDPRTRSELVMPLSTAQGIIGVLDLQSPEMHAFSKRDQRILTAFGERAAAALETMQLYEEVNRRAIELERRVAERTAQLQQTTERIEAILNNSSDAIIVLQPDGTITNTNPAFSAVFGYTSDAVLKQPLAMLFESQENNSIIEALHSVVGGQSSVRSEIVARRADGATFYADSLFSPIKEANNKIVGIVCSLRDITARKNMEADLRVALAKEKELGELKSRFASMVSHEFRTPLATIQALIETLSAYRHKLPDDQIDERLDKIKDQVGNLKDIMEDVLLLARMQSRRVEFNPAKVDLDALCRSVLDEFLSHTDTKHQLVYVCNDDLHEVMLDRKLMRQIIGNVLSNAIKYSPEGKTVYVNLEHVESAVILKVRDEGIGIPQADLKHLFEPFHRAANVGTISGTGLGLVIVKEVTELHGGTIAVESQVNVGTTFTIRIPISITGDDDDENSGD